ncbi:MAG TPA: signal peptide peptidase SppA [Candidatus Alistipes merdigallinarum]|nr:signal peptide peptidase SppA [Candidatus Alistipes merdigallinarum]
MNQFIKTFLACLLALVVAGVLASVFFVMVVVSFGTFFSEKIPEVKEKSVLRIDFSEPVYDNPSYNPFSVAGFGDLMNMQIRGYALIDVLKAIEAAETDDRIAGIYLNITPNARMGLATMQEIRNALSVFRRSGKFIVSHADFYTQGSYYLSSVADRVLLNPQGDVTWYGMASGTLFYKGLLDKLEVQVEAIRHGSFKSAVEPFVMDQMSPENRQQIEMLLGSLWGTVVRDIADSRGIDSVALQSFATNLEIKDATYAKQLGMVDSLMYGQQVEQMLGEWTEQEEPQYVSLRSYIDRTLLEESKVSKNKIAVVYAEGQIVDGKSREGLVGGETLARQLSALKDDDQVKAVVLRVNSPGGSALASEVIWHEAEALRQVKPLIVSMGNMAASGGYYISAPADMILASPLTETGSIGVFGLVLNGEQGLKNKLGISVDVVKTNPSADMGLTVFGAVGVRPLSQSERDYMQYGVEQVYKTFVGHVAEGRNLSVEEVDRIGGGHIWSGIDALNIGLIDGFGGLKEAVSIAAERAGVADDFRIVSPVTDESRLTQIMKLLSVEARSQMFQGEAGEVYEMYDMLRNILYPNSIQALTPYRVEMK